MKIPKLNLIELSKTSSSECWSVPLKFTLDSTYTCTSKCFNGVAFDCVPWNNFAPKWHYFQTFRTFQHRIIVRLFAQNGAVSHTTFHGSKTWWSHRFILDTQAFWSVLVSLGFDVPPRKAILPAFVVLYIRTTRACVRVGERELKYLASFVVLNNWFFVRKFQFTALCAVRSCGFARCSVHLCVWSAIVYCAEVALSLFDGVGAWEMFAVESAFCETIYFTYGEGILFCLFMGISELEITCHFKHIKQ